VPDRFTRWVVGGVAAICVAISTFNFAVDPDEHRSQHLLRTLDGHRHVPLMSPAAKLQLLARTRCERLLVGSSRVELAFDPESPHFDGAVTCNLGVSGSSVLDQAEVIVAAEKSHPPREVIWALDFVAFSSRHRHVIWGQPRVPLPALSAARLAESVLVLKRRSEGTRSGYRARGFLAEPPFRALSLTRFKNDLRDYSPESGVYRDFEVDGRALKAVAEVAHRARRAGRPLVLVILPVHAVHLELLRRGGLLERYDAWVEALLSAAGQPIIDFTGYRFPNRESIPDGYEPMQWFWDSNHVTARYGTLILQDLRDPLPRFGAVLSGPAAYRAGRAGWDAEGARWRRDNARTLEKLGL
jgi:hypothetical protein